jgi:hypothetical protein
MQFPVASETLQCGIKVWRCEPAVDQQVQVKVMMALPDDSVIPLDCLPSDSSRFRYAVGHDDPVRTRADGREFEWPLQVDEAATKCLIFQLGAFPLAGAWEFVAELHLDSEITPQRLQQWRDSQEKNSAKGRGKEGMLEVRFGNGTVSQFLLPRDGKPMQIQVAVPNNPVSITLQGAGDWPMSKPIVLEGARLRRKQ